MSIYTVYFPTLASRPLSAVRPTQTLDCHNEDNAARLCLSSCEGIVNTYNPQTPIGPLPRQPVAATLYQCQYPDDTSFCPGLPTATESLTEKLRCPESKWSKLGNQRAGTTEGDISAHTLRRSLGNWRRDAECDTTYVLTLSPQRHVIGVILTISGSVHYSCNALFIYNQIPVNYVTASLSVQVMSIICSMEVFQFVCSRGSEETIPKGFIRYHTHLSLSSNCLLTMVCNSEQTA